MRKKILWATPGRTAKLAHLAVEHGPQLAQEFYASLDAVVFDGMALTLYSERIVRQHFDELIGVWKAHDREEREAVWQQERRLLHRGPNPGKTPAKRGRFDSIARDEYMANRPMWHITAIGVDPLTHRRTVKVEIPSIKEVVWVEIKAQVKGLSRKVRKLARCRGSVPKELVDALESEVSKAMLKHI